MSAFVVDPFQYMLPGPATPSGWGFPNGGDGIVVAFGGTAPGPWYSSGGAVTPHNWYAFLGAPLISPMFLETSLNINWFARFYALGAFGPIAYGLGMSAIPDKPLLELAIIQVEADGTLSVYAGPGTSQLCCNTGTYPLAFNVNNANSPSQSPWNYIQISLTLSTDLDSGFLNVSASIAIDGTVITSGAADSSFYTPDSLPSMGFGFSNVGWVSGFGRYQDIGEPFILANNTSPTLPGGIWSITMTDEGGGYTAALTTVTIVGGLGSGAAAYPIIGTGGAITGILFLPGSGYGMEGNTPPTVEITGDGAGASAVVHLEPDSMARISQAPIEIGIEPSSANVRIAQAAMEISMLPSTAKVRIAQAVIELATLPPYPPPCQGLTPNPETDNSFLLQKVVASFKKPTIRLPVR